MKQLTLLCVAISFFVFPFFNSLHAQGNREANALARQGTEAAKNKEWDEAVDALRKATEMDRKYAPSLAAALQQRATAYASQQQFQEAATDFDEAIKLNPRNASVYEGRASVAMKMNDLDKALAMYSEAIKINPHEPRYYSYRAYIYELKGDLTNAMADTEKLLKLQKDNPEALARKARLQARQAQAAPPPPPPAPQRKP
jgi:tetratricopeptide (TPR) repeat protein